MTQLNETSFEHEVYEMQKMEQELLINEQEREIREKALAGREINLVTSIFGIFADPYIANNWIDTLGEKAFCFWLKLLAIANPSHGFKGLDQFHSKAELVKLLKISDTKFDRHITRPLYNYGLIEISNIENSNKHTKRGNYCRKYKVFTAPLGDELRALRPLVKIRDYDSFEEFSENKARQYGAMGAAIKKVEASNYYDTLTPAPTPFVEYFPTQMAMDVSPQDAFVYDGITNEPEMVTNISPQDAFISDGIASEDKQVLPSVATEEYVSKLGTTSFDEHDGDLIDDALNLNMTENQDTLSKMKALYIYRNTRLYPSDFNNREIYNADFYFLNIDILYNNLLEYFSSSSSFKLKEYENLKIFIKNHLKENNFSDFDITKIINELQEMPASLTFEQCKSKIVEQVEKMRRMIAAGEKITYPPSFFKIGLSRLLNESLIVQEYSNAEKGRQTIIELFKAGNMDVYWDGIELNWKKSTYKKVEFYNWLEERDDSYELFLESRRSLYEKIGAEVPSYN